MYMMKPRDRLLKSANNQCSLNTGWSWPRMLGLEALSIAPTARTKPSTGYQDGISWKLQCNWI